MDGRDAMEFILAGASAVEIGTANFIDPAATVKIVEWIDNYCTRHGVEDINELIGAINQ